MCVVDCRPAVSAAVTYQALLTHERRGGRLSGQKAALALEGREYIFVIHPALKPTQSGI